MAAPVQCWRWLSSGTSVAIAALVSRMIDRACRMRERSSRSSWLLLAPLLGEMRHLPSMSPPHKPISVSHLSIKEHFSWISEELPAFNISGSQVCVLHSPAEFYQVMKDSIKLAKRRIVMASLYLGTGPLEQELVDSIQAVLEESNSSGLQVSILLDYTRGSRGKINSRTILLPLLKKFPHQLRVSLYHTPDLRGLLKLLVPERFNETIGLQHIKVYLFDDSLIISGANLSDSYFTNRQDRYIMLRDCKEIADFFTELIKAVGDVSMQLQPDDTVCIQEGAVHPFRGNRKDFCHTANRRIMEVVNTARALQSNKTAVENKSLKDSVENDQLDTWIFPLIQMKPFGIRLDERVTKRLLVEAADDSRVYLTSGYFNLTHAYMDLVLGTRADYHILMASPEVNGFFGAKGVAGAIPAAYVHIAKQFYDRVCQQGQQNRIQLLEYFRSNWTFHAKGLWYYLKETDRPCLTLIGSPNFGYRSVHRDLEAQVAIVTANKSLQAKLQQEQEQLYEKATAVSASTFKHPNRYVKLWVKLVTPLIKNFF
ncbi:CDP-diacylglycerol--glycerol-3-phosphate 3-phosphatidyltransferase, mitochondrial isoform X2 [Erpetoichthys calabaricus]|uniref:CDP-diacylglycerol--glycerol-3-phosphate 3-phosphatidyltransferase, mitochondrial isoform X2 n=1 Tax=Erpetoichthys calabaricus TaxID=27687 RepID=UPI002233E5FF|nr:CDP-diacylglycerol--glycerol-3-phosphate 3-phosphatidyltransferase, mitochondrial isoform X2 [Erpetoichthys calabaricus]